MPNVLQQPRVSYSAFLPHEAPVEASVFARIYRPKEGRTFVLPDIDLASEILTFLGSNRSGVVETTGVSPLADDADIRTA